MRNNLGICLTFNNRPVRRPGLPDGLTPRTTGPVTLAMITDGTSNTAIFSEWIKGKNTEDRQAITRLREHDHVHLVRTGALPALLRALQATLSTLHADLHDQWHAGLGPEGMAWGDRLVRRRRRLQPPARAEQAGLLLRERAPQRGGPNGHDTIITMVGASSNHSGGRELGFSTARSSSSRTASTSAPGRRSPPRPAVRSSTPAPTE